MSDRFHPEKDNVAFVIIDFQDNLVAAMEKTVQKKVSRNIGLLISLAKVMHIPIIITEQYPKGLGKTTSKLVEELGHLYQPIEKLVFNCYAHPSFAERIKNLGVKHIVLTGTETHVCVLQTALDLLADGYEVSVVSDAACSRYKSDEEAGLRLLQQAGGVVTSTEIITFQLLKQSGTDEFKFMSPLLKQR